MSPDTDAATAAALALLRAQYQELLQRLETNQSDFQHLARSVYRVQEDERRRIARELHDGIGQNLTALKHQLALAREQLPAGQHELAERLAASGELCARTLEETRELSRLLRPQILDDLGLAAALQWLARNIETIHGPHIELELQPLPPLDPELQTLLFRISQEALANVVRHARASEVQVRLTSRAGRVMLMVWDNGIGFDPAAAERAASAGRSAGIPGMRERARLHGGDLQVESGAETGTRLRVSIPVAAAAQP